jgi:magnesium and cobalt transporter
MNKDQHPAGAAPHSRFSRLTKWLTRAAADNEQLLVTLHDAQMNGLFDADALAMIEGVLQVDDMQVRDIMIPRTQVVMLERDASRDVLIRTIIESGHSRFPVIGDSRDEVVGILLAKDLLLYAFERNDGRLNVRDILRPAVFIPESKRLNVLLKEFRSSRNHMAMVVDEYGGVAGMVTIEDVLEQIVGEIEDEHDVEEEDTIRKHSEMH